MLGESVSTQYSMGCIVALVWVIMAAAGCTERESTAASKRLSENTASGPAGSSATPKKGKVDSAGTAKSASRYSDGCGAPASAPGVHYRSLEHSGW
jgi:hypothetical protein